MNIIVAAALVAIGLIVGGLALGGRYEIVAVGSDAYLLDRFTGGVERCDVTYFCVGFDKEKPPSR